MFGIGDTVLYGSNGVCKIAGITRREMGGKTEEYFELKPVSDERSLVLVPLENQQLLGRMRRLLSRDEVENLIESMPQEQSVWIEDEHARKDAYREILRKGEPRGLVRLIRTLYRRKMIQSEKGRKLHATDERFFNEAEKLLYDEFSYTLQIDRDEVIPYIVSRIGEENL